MKAALAHLGHRARLRATSRSSRCSRWHNSGAPGCVQAAIRPDVAHAQCYARVHLGLIHHAFDRVLPRPTLRSTRKNKSRRLSKAVSENLFRLPRLTAGAEDAFGDLGRANQWLITPYAVFDEEAPPALADTEAGAEWVETVLLRMMYSVDRHLMLGPSDD